MDVSRRVVRAHRSVRGLVAGVLVALVVSVYLLLPALLLELDVRWALAAVLAAGLVTGLLVVAVDGSTRRTAARQAGWPGDPDLLAVVQVDAAQGVLPTTEPERELAYRFAVRAWSRRWTLWLCSGFLVALSVGVVAALATLDAGAAALLGLLPAPLALLLLHQSLVVLPRLRRIVREVEGAHHPGQGRPA